jgi:hypothetical protein
MVHICSCHVPLLRLASLSRSRVGSTELLFDQNRMTCTIEIYTSPVTLVTGNGINCWVSYSGTQPCHEIYFILPMKVYSVFLQAEAAFLSRAPETGTTTLHVASTKVHPERQPTCALNHTSSRHRLLSSANARASSSSSAAVRDSGGFSRFFPGNFCLFCGGPPCSDVDPRSNSGET